MQFLRSLRTSMRPLGVEYALYAYGAAKGQAKIRPHRASMSAGWRSLDLLREKRLIFSISAGRTGSEYLTRLLQALPDTVAFHEPEPAFQRVLRATQRRPEAAREFLLRYKLPWLARHAEGTIAETSHLVGKGFLEPMVELGLRPAFIVLRREPRSVALSYLARYTVPGRTRYGWQFLLEPDDPGVFPLPRWRAFSDYQLCFWYALEMERRAVLYGDYLQTRGLLYADVTARELNDPDVFLAMLESLGCRLASPQSCDIISAHATISGKVHNANPRQNQQARPLEQDEAPVWSALRDHDAQAYAAICSRWEMSV